MSLRRILSTGAVAVALGLGVATPASTQARGGLFEEGLQRYRAGEYAEAQRLLREYVQAHGERGADPHLGEAYHYLGLMTPEARLAEGYFLAVAQRYPASPVADEARARLGQLYTVLGNYPEARKQWQALASEYPLSRYVPEVPLRIGETFFAQGEWADAYEQFSSGFARMKDFQRSGGRGANLRELEGEYVYWLGRTLLARKAFGDARKYLNLVTLDYPGHPLEPLALYYLAESYRGEAKTVEADEAWRRFSESVRNTSLEAVAADPALLAAARARADAAAAGPGAVAEPAGVAPSRAAPGGLGPAGAREPEEREITAPERGATADRETPLPERRAEAEGVDVPAERAGAGRLEPPGEDEALRAPQPGRPGGVVRAEPLGKRVQPAAPAAPEEIAEPADPADSLEAVAAAQAAAPGEAAVAPGAAGEREAAPTAAPVEGGRAAREAQPVESARAVPPATPPVETARGAAAAPAADEDAAAARSGRPAGDMAAPTDQRAALLGAGRAPARPAPSTAAGERVVEERAGGRRAADDRAREAQALERAREVAAGGAAAAPRPAPPAGGGEAAPEEGPPDSRVYVQVGAFTSAQRAAELAAQLRSKGYQPGVETGLVRGEGYYRVRLGPYELPRELAAVEKTRADLNRAGFASILVRPEPVE